MLERQIMFKQLQELQRQKKLQELNDACQQNVMHNKHSSMTQYGLINNGVQVRDASQMFMFGDTNLVHGLPNRFVYSQAENQGLQSISHHAHFQGPVFSQGLQIGSQTRKAQKVNSDNRYIEFGGIQESGMEYASGNHQDLASLDPLEQKILFNMEENVFKKSSDFGSLQSGSWSALMQSAASEASNGDSGVQEEWSGLSYQNPELSNENQESGKHQIPWKYKNLPEEVTFGSSENSGMSGFKDISAVSVKKEHGEKKSTFVVKPGIASSRRQPNIWVDAVQQTPPSTSYAANRKMETVFGLGSSKMQQHANHGTAVSLKQAHMNYDPSKRAVIKKDKLEYDNTIPQVTSLSHLNSACGNYKSQLISSSATDHSVKASIDQGGSVNKVAFTCASSIYLHQLDVAKEKMVALKSKKRKRSTFEQIESCTGLHDMRNAELEWARSVNRIPEKVADFLQIVDRKKRRLILTTQLMQMLFKPAPKIVFSEDATKHCDTITYYVAKFGLGDACRTSRSIGDHDFIKVVEGFIDRSKRLEDMLSRFEKGESSILDVKVEFQDLEKFSVINRFAKFHSRGPVVTTDTSSSDGGSTMQKLDPQRYVTASEMPSIVPEGQCCLLL